mmetsp:Transcript_19019/g.41650  ORF Transcript_19019/g.41650 Transcript_19019/m.41650 type:complete len:204 (+) Transcript_19019:1748-2359(+)
MLAMRSPLPPNFADTCRTICRSSTNRLCSSSSRSFRDCATRLRLLALRAIEVSMLIRRSFCVLFPVRGLPTTVGRDLFKSRLGSSVLLLLLSSDRFSSTSLLIIEMAETLRDMERHFAVRPDPRLAGLALCPPTCGGNTLAKLGLGVPNVSPSRASSWGSDWADPGSVWFPSVATTGGVCGGVGGGDSEPRPGPDPSRAWVSS